MLKHPDYHFGNDSTEVFIKLACWIFSTIPIFVIWKEMLPKIFNSSLAIPIFILGISCCSDTFLLQKQRTETIPVIFFRTIFTVFLLICVTSFTIAISKEIYPDWILTWFFRFFISILVLMAIDSIIWFKLDTIPKQKEPSRSELINLFNKALNKKQ